MTQTKAARMGGANRGTSRSTTFLRAAMIAGAAALSLELLMLAAVPAVAVAGSPDQVRVAHRDLDLTTDAGLIVLDHRINAAARTACRTPDRVSDPIIGYRRCLADTLAAARSQVAGIISRRRASAGAASLSRRGVH